MVPSASLGMGSIYRRIIVSNEKWSADRLQDELLAMRFNQSSAWVKAVQHLYDLAVEVEADEDRANESALLDWIFTAARK